MFEKLRGILNPSSKETIFTAMEAGESVRLDGPFLEQPPSSNVTHNNADGTLVTDGNILSDSMPANTANKTPSSIEIEVMAHAMGRFLQG